MTADRSQQGLRLNQTLLQRMDREYRGRKFDIIRQVHLPAGKVFLTKFGKRGRHGYVIQDRETGEQQVVGWKMLKRIHDLYLGVNLPTIRMHHRDANYVPPLKCKQ